MRTEVQLGVQSGGKAGVREGAVTVCGLLPGGLRDLRGWLGDGLAGWRGALGPGAVPALTVLCGLVAVLAVGVVRGHPGRWPVAVLVAVGVVLAEARPLHFAHGGERRTFTFCEGPLVVGLVLGSGWLLVVGFTAGIVATQLARRLPVAKVLFNIAQYAAAAGVAVVLTTVVPGIPGVLLAITGFAVVNDLAVQWVLRLTAGTRVGLPFGDRALIWFLHMAGATSAAILVGSAMESDGALALAFVAPIVLVNYSQREAMKQHVSAQVLRSIADQAVAHTTDRATLTSLITRTAREVLAADRAELVLLEGPHPLLTTDNDGQLSENRISEDWYLTDHALRTALDSGPTGTARGRWAAVVIGTATHPRALLTVTRPHRQEPFRDTDLDALRILAHKTATWLSTTHVTGSTYLSARVIDLTIHRTGTLPPRPAPSRRVTELLTELDLLRTRLNNLTPDHNQPATPLGELEESQRRLTAALSEVLTTHPHDEPAVAIGAWHPLHGTAV